VSSGEGTSGCGPGRSFDSVTPWDVAGAEDAHRRDGEQARKSLAWIEPVNKDANR
jgi:hypothetical protein